MQSTLTLQETDPHDIFAIEPDIVPAARAAQPSPDPVHEILSLLSHRRAQTTSGVSAGASIPTVDTTFRAAAVDTVKIPRDRSAIGRWAKNTSIAFLFALCSAVAASAWQHHGDAARQMIAGWLPPFVLASSAPAETPPPAEQAGSSPVQAPVADQAPVPPATPAQPAAAAQPSESAAPAAAAAPPADSTPLLQSMARDLASMGQQIEQLKASIEQIKTAQAQMPRDTLKGSEQNPRARMAALPPRPVAPPPRKPRPAFAPAPVAASTLRPPQYAPPLPPPQPALSASSYPPAPPPQVTAEPDGEPVVRPPMPLR